jgi:hypothetical protein
MSCDDWTSFFGRLDLDPGQTDTALSEGNIDYCQAPPLSTFDGGGAVDLSRILGSLGPRYRESPPDMVVMDDVNLMLDLRSEEGAVSSMFALLYALKARFREIILFSNPLRSDLELEYMTHMRDFLVVHAPIPPRQAA